MRTNCLDITITQKTSCKDVATRVGRFALQYILCLGEGQLPLCPHNGAPGTHDFPVLDFYKSNICYCFMKCDYFNVKDDIVAYVVHLCCILPPKPRFRWHSVNTLNIDVCMYVCSSASWFKCSLTCFYMLFN